MELPEFEDMQNTVEEILKLSLKKASLDLSIKVAEADVFKQAIVDEKYFQGGKPPSATYIENAYKQTGLEGEIIPKREELGDITARLEYQKNKLELMKTLVEIWRSEQANQRVSVLA